MEENRNRNFQRRERDRRPEVKDDQLIYGIRAVMEAIHAGKEVERLFITRGSGGELMNELKTLLREKNIAWTEVPIEKIHRITRNNHQDVVCFISAISYDSISDVVPAIFEKGETPLLLILDRITDVRNFGAIARTAECAGVHAIVIPLKGAAQVTADAIKTSAGALSKISVCRENSLRRTIDFLQQSGLRVVAASEKGSKNYFEADLSGPMAIVMGSEEDGISNDIIKVSDELVKIPLMGKIGSLNVSVATGVMLFESLRQRIAK
jgi:23S rRNA (guanosine2251-2'-O)-methyltransferase